MRAMLRPRGTRIAGLILTLAYAVFIVSVYAWQPRTVAQITGAVASSMGAYRVDQASFDEGLRFFRNDQFPEARRSFARADPAQRDPTTQFYVAYSFYRQGWGRLYHDDALFAEGLEAVRRAVAASPTGHVMVGDENLGMRTSDELQVELERGLLREASDLNPLKVLRRRK